MMLKIIAKRKSSVQELGTTQLFDEESFYKQFCTDLRSAKKSIVIESPYLTTKRTQTLLKSFNKLSNKGVLIKIYSREPRHHMPQLKAEALACIPRLKKVGVRVFLCNDLRHRKIAIIDGQILWEGSLNIMSQSNSREIMRRTESVKLCQQVLRFTKLQSIYRW